MIIRIPTDQLKVGMFVHELDLPWHRHPFLFNKFTLRTEKEIDAISETGLRFVDIDDSKGIGPAKKTLRKPANSTAARSTPAKAPQQPAPIPTINAKQDHQQEVRKASKLINKSKKSVLKLFDDARLGKAINHKKMTPLVDQILETVDKDPSIILNIARLKTKDEYTYLHSVSVCALMMNFARKLNLGEDKVRELGLAGMLHDVGKMVVPETILNKPGKLEHDEIDIVRTHPAMGHQILSASKNIHPTALDVCLNHHEKMDGTGYPGNLDGGELSLAARMAAICDVYDAVTSQRSYNQPWTASEALAKMQQWTGHFDQMLLQAFIESLGIMPKGSFVRLSNRTLAIVIGEDPADFSQARVRSFYDLERKVKFEPCDIQLSRARPDVRVVCREDPKDFVFKDNELTEIVAMENVRTLDLL